MNNMKWLSIAFAAFGSVAVSASVAPVINYQAMDEAQQKPAQEAQHQQRYQRQVARSPAPMAQPARQQDMAQVPVNELADQARRNQQMEQEQQQTAQSPSSENEYVDEDEMDEDIQTN